MTTGRPGDRPLRCFTDSLWFGCRGRRPRRPVKIYRNGKAESYFVYMIVSPNRCYERRLLKFQARRVRRKLGEMCLKRNAEGQSDTLCMRLVFGVEF